MLSYFIYSMVDRFHSVTLREAAALRIDEVVVVVDVPYLSIRCSGATAIEGRVRHCCITADETTNASAAR
jgi:hypothetical protein